MCGHACYLHDTLALPTAAPVVSTKKRPASYLAEDTRVGKKGKKNVVAAEQEEEEEEDEEEQEEVGGHEVNI